MMVTGNSARSLRTAATPSPTKKQKNAIITPTKTPSSTARDNENHLMLSDSERQYDIGNKGRLTKFERQLKDLDAEADLVFDLNTAGDMVDPRWSRRRLFSTAHQEQSSRGSIAHQYHQQYQLQDMSLETDAGGNVVLDESEQNYKGYLTKVQRDFQNMSELDQLEQQEQQDNSYLKNNTNNNDPRGGSFATFPMDRSNASYTMNNSSGHVDGLFRATRSALSPRTVGVEYQYSSMRSLLTLGVVAVLLLCNMIVSGMMWKATLEMGKHQLHDLSADARGRLVQTQNDRSAMTQVSVLGSGKTFVLSVRSSPFSQDSPHSSDGEETLAPNHNPYACMGLAGAVDLWKSVMEGVTTTVLLVHNDTMDTGGSGVRMMFNDTSATSNHHDELGIQLTFQGATQNATQACINTLNPHKTLCIDFSSHRCETSPSSFHHYDDTIMHDDENNGGEKLQHERKELFRKSLAEESAIAGGSTLSPTHHACNQGQIGHNWCHSFASVVLVGNP